MSELEKLDLGSGDPDEERREKLVELFPEACEDGKIDLEALKRALGDVIDEGDERYTFTWPGKADAIRQSQIPSKATLRPRPEKSVNWDTTKNLYIEGDNLEVLKLLQRAYHGKVKMIYIDPPYNTGHDFVYKDSFGDSVKNYKEQAGLTNQSNAETSGRFHSAWCSMMYPRLKLARELLSDDGVIIASIDESERLDLQAILNETFGENNFAGEIVWKNSSKNDSAYVSMQHEYLLLFVKDKGVNAGEWVQRKDGLQEIYSAFDGFRQRYGNDWKAIHAAALDWYKQFPPSSPVYGSKHYSWMDERGVYFPDNISGPNDGQYVYDVVHPVTGKVCKAPGRGWFCPKDEMKRRISENLIHFGDDETTVPNLKTYLRNTENQSLPSILYKDGRVASKKLAKMFGAKVFSNPKDDEVISQLMTALGVSNDDVVLDFFSGSGTTAESAMRANETSGSRIEWLLVQLPENLDENLKTATGSSKKIVANAISYLDNEGKPHLLTELAEDRIVLAGKIIAAEVEKANLQPSFDEEPKKIPDVGFRVLSLDESCFDESDGTQLLDSVIKEDRSDQDVIMEVMLKWGLEPTLPVEQVEAAGYPCWSVANGELVCCMAEGLSVKALEAIAAISPRRVLILDRVLDDSLKLNASYIFGKGTPEGDEIELRTV